MGCNDLLDALDVDGLRPPFHNGIPKRETPSPDRWLFDETPTTAAGSLPTPSTDHLDLQVSRAYCDDNVPFHSHLDDTDIIGDADASHWNGDSLSFQAPGAPLIKDRDSFNDGTTVGSFDFSLPNSPRIPYIHLEPDETMACCPHDPHDPMRAIETWRDGVITTVAHPANSCPDEVIDAEPCGLMRGVKRQRSSAFSDADYDEKLARAKANASQGPRRRWPGA